jgi:hypothetical protein
MSRNKAVFILTQWIADCKIWCQKGDAEIDTKGRQKVDPETVTNWRKRAKYSKQISTK